MKSSVQTIRTRGFDALVHELGAIDAARFMRQFDQGHGDWTKERHGLLRNLSVDAIATGIMADKHSSAESGS